MINVQYIQKKRINPGVIIAAFLITGAVVLFLFYPFAFSKQESYFKGENPILFNGHQYGNALVERKTLYLPLTFIKKEIDQNIEYDQKSQSIILTTANKVIQMPTDSVTYFVNQQPVKLQVSPIKKVNHQMYVAIDPIIAFYPIQYRKLAGSKAIWIQKDRESYFKGQINNQDEPKQLLRLRTKPSLFSPYTAEVKKKEKIAIVNEKTGFYLVRKEDGVSGYVKKEMVQKGKKRTIQITRSTELSKIPLRTDPIQLTWEAVYTKNPDTNKIPEMQGVNVVSPTWFSLADQAGTIKNLASLEYSNWARSRGYQVWGLFSNGFDPNLTHEALKDFETRQKIIVQLLHYSQMYQLQGVNFDIENVNKTDGPLVTQLLREAIPYFHEAGLLVSVDITFSVGESNWSSFYERKKLAQIADYIIVMAYDEHWGASSGAGSVASFPWVEQNLTRLLTEVPNERLILGVPLYARLWKEQLKEDGTKEVTAKALTMNNAKAWIAERNVVPIYDKSSGQNYVEYIDPTDNTRYRLWMEDEMSLKKRSDLALKYNLAGIASWSRYFGDQTAWTALTLDRNQTVTKK